LTFQVCSKTCSSHTVLRSPAARRGRRGDTGRDGVDMVDAAARDLWVPRPELPGRLRFLPVRAGIGRTCGRGAVKPGRRMSACGIWLPGAKGARPLRGLNNGVSPAHGAVWLLFRHAPRRVAARRVMSARRRKSLLPGSGPDTTDVGTLINGSAAIYASVRLRYQSNHVLPLAARRAEAPHPDERIARRH
jgi:hypothetical protein